MDVDTLEPGVDFFEHIEQSIGSVAVLIAVIGKGWANAVDEDGNRRLDKPDDWVRLEVGGALRRDIRVIPVLLGGAQMPEFEELPDDLADLRRRSGLELYVLEDDEEGRYGRCRRLAELLTAGTCSRRRLAGSSP